MTAEAAAFAAPAAKAGRAEQLRVVAGWLWSGALLLLLGFLVLYPVAMLLLGALTNTNPVVDGFGVFDLSLANFVTVLGNPNVHDALANSLIAINERHAACDTLTKLHSEFPSPRPDLRDAIGEATQRAGCR